MNIKKFIVDVLEEVYGKLSIEDNVDLLEEEILDSIGIMYLVTQIEEKLNVTVSLADINESNFQNIESIEKLIKTYIK